MSTLSKLAQRFQGVENLVPRAWRLPLRYHGQRLVGGLEPEMDLLEQLVPKDCTALDVGANHGIYTYALSRFVRSVHCFEPLAECCRYIRDHPATNVTVHNVALSDGAGELELHIPIIRGRAVYTRASLDPPKELFDSRRVEVRTLDSYGLKDVGFIKIDVEGLEAAVLRGARHTLETCHPAMLIEIDRTRHDRDSFLAVHAMLQEMAYRPHVCEAKELVVCQDVWATSSRHINFIFK